MFAMMLFDCAFADIEEFKRYRTDFHEISWARILGFSKPRGAPVFDGYEYPSALCSTEQCL
jgi:hypothetical protein